MNCNDDGNNEEKPDREPAGNPAEKPVQSGQEISQDIEEYLDVDCWAGRDSEDTALWRQRVYLDKHARKVVPPDLTEYSPDECSGFDELGEEEKIPEEIARALKEEIEKATREILLPELDRLNRECVK